MSLGQTLSGFWHSIQADLFPWLEEELGPLGGRYRRFVTVLEFARVESFLPHFRSLPGRPVEDRAALARAFIAKAVFDIPTTRALIERLQVDRTLRRLCGWTYAGEIPSEATFSRAFAEFSASALPARLHEALIEKTLGDHLVGHVSRDATAIEARERPAPKPRAEKPKRKRGRPRKGEERPRELRRVERQLKMTLPQMLDDLPKACAVGTKRNAKGHTTSALRHLGHALAGQRLRGHEHVAGSAAPVFVVVPGRPARFGGDRLARLADQLAGCLVHAYHRKGRIEGTAINIEHRLHRGREIRVALRWDHPPDPLPRLDLVFLEHGARSRATRCRCGRAPPPGRPAAAATTARGPPAARHNSRPPGAPRTRRPPCGHTMAGVLVVRRGPPPALPPRSAS